MRPLMVKVAVACRVSLCKALALAAAASGGCSSKRRVLSLGRG